MPVDGEVVVLKSEATETGETEESIASLSDEDLSSRLDAARKGGVEGTTEPEPAPAKEPEVETKVEPTETAQPVPTLESLQAEIEKTRALYKSAEEFNQQLKKEHAQYRQFVDAEIQRRKEQGVLDPTFDFSEAWAQDPKTAVETAARRIIDGERQMAELHAMELSRAESDNRNILMGSVGDITPLLEDIVGLVKADGAPDEFVSSLRTTPYRIDSAVILNLAHRAKLSKENATLKAELEKARAELSTKADDVAKKISEAAKKGPVVSGTSGGAGTTKTSVLEDGMTEEQIAKLSGAELEEVLAKLRGKG